MQSSQIGFAAAARDQPADDTDLLQLAQSRDFIDYGMEPEFIGRLPVRVACQSLTAEDLEKILLTSEGSILQQYRADFSGYGIDFEITLEAVREIATPGPRRAHRRPRPDDRARTRAARLQVRTALHRDQERSRSTAPPSPRRPETLAGAAASRTPRSSATCSRPMSPPLPRASRRTTASNSPSMKTAIERLIELSLAADKTIRALCEEKFRDFHHGLKLIARDGEPRRFVITREVVDAPDKVLSRWVVERFRAADKRSGA